MAKLQMAYAKSLRAIGQSLEASGSGLLILIISSGRNPLHGPTTADRISWSVLPRQHPRQ